MRLRRQRPGTSGAAGRWLGLLCLCASGAQDPPAEEYEVKAKMIQQLLKFVEWPEKALGEPGAAFVVGVLGDDPFGAHLDRALDGKSVKTTHKIVLRRLGSYSKLADPKLLKECHLLFVSASEQKHLEEIFKSLKNRSTLTIGDTDEFTRKGGILRFYVDDEHHLRMEINTTALADAMLTAVARLLDLARLVR